jgi:4-amino-4-deoxy-L-arabinose transferase-like glycosyltransferase
MATLTLPRIEPGEAPALARRDWRPVLYWLPLVLVLIVQAALTVRLIPQGYAGTDEARYIDAGHALIYEFWHGGGSPYFETYFSGAPDVYSPIAAMADFIGGLAAVRLLSTCFMLVATVMMYLSGRRLFGYWSAVAACALFVGLQSTHVVGRNAIYDSMALMLMTVAAYCATRSKEAKWLLLVPLALLAADAAKYVTLLFDPTVILIAAYQLKDQGLRAVGKRVCVLGGATGLALGFAVFLAGSSYLKGIEFTTLGRHTGNSVLLGANPAPTIIILHEAWHWFGLIIVLAFLAAALSSLYPRERGRALLLLTFAVTSTLVTLEAIHLGSDESSGRHDDFAAWFGCMAAGYLLVLVVQAAPWKYARAVLALGVVVVIGFSGVLYTSGKHAFISTDETIPQVPSNYAIMKPYLATNQRYLLSGNDDYALVYNDHDYVQWWNLLDDNYIKYPIPGRGGNWGNTTRGLTCTVLLPDCQYLTGAAGYQAAVKAHDFAVISITRPAGHQLASDAVIEKAVKSTPGYVLLTHSGGGPTWIYAPDYEHLKGGH